MDGLQCTHNFPNQRVGAASYIRMRENQKARTTTIDCAPKTLSVNNSTPTNSSLYISTLSHWTPYIISCRASKTSCLDICQKPTLSFDLVASTSYYIFYTTPLFFFPIYSCSSIHYTISAWSLEQNRDAEEQHVHGAKPWRLWEWWYPEELWWWWSSQKNRYLIILIFPL